MFEIGKGEQPLTPVVAPLSVYERAIELAGSGECTSVNDVRQHLRGEGYTDVVAGLAGSAANQAIVRALTRRRLQG